MESGRPGELYELPVAPIPAAEIALEELELVYAFVYARVGNRPDAEDLTQQVALKAIPRLREGASVSAIRAYLFATARSALASFWASRFGMPEDELRDDLWVEKAEPDATGEPVERVKVAHHGWRIGLPFTGLPGVLPQPVQIESPLVPSPRAGRRRSLASRQCLPRRMHALSPQPSRSPQPLW